MERLQEIKITDPVFELSEKWADTEISLFQYLAATEDIPGKQGVFIENLEDFTRSFRVFGESPVFGSLSITAFSQIKILEDIADYLAEIHSAVKEDRRDLILPLVFKIQKKLNGIQQLNAAAGDAVHMNYFYLFFIFVGVLTVMVVVMWQLNSALDRSLLRERRSFTFSRDVILAQEEERSRIARELHDTVAQDLRCLGLQAAQIARGIEDQNIRLLCDDIVRRQVLLLVRVRSICSELIPPDFRHQGLIDALRQLCIDFGTRTGLECRISVQDALSIGGLSIDSQLQCFRMVQEALTNIEKHAHAKEATVTLRNSIIEGSDKKQTLLICVSDDGQGFEKIPTRENYDTMGLRGMYERIAILGGALTFNSERGEGTMVRIEIPLE